MTDLVKNPAFALHIAMVGQNLDFDKIMKQTLPIILYRSYSVKNVVTIIHLRIIQYPPYQITFEAQYLSNC